MGSLTKYYRMGGYFNLPVCLLVYFLGISPANAVITFEKCFGGTAADAGYSVTQTTDGGYIISGGTHSYGADSGDVWLIKTDSLGDTLWTRTYGGTLWNDWGASVAQTSDRGYIITGQTESYGLGSGNVWLIKTDSLGDSLWTRIFGGTGWDIGNFVVQTTDGGYVITGETGSYGAGSQDFWFIKTDSLGDSLWTKTFGGTYFDQGWSAQQTTDGGYIITGGTDSYGAGNQDVWFIKTDSLGDSLWTKTFGGTGWDYSVSVAQTTDDGYIVTGWTDSYGAGSSDAWLIKTDSLGDSLWTRTFGGAADDFAFSVAQTTDEGYIITGYTESFGAGNRDVWLIKTDSLGDSLWIRTFGGTDSEHGHSVAQTTDGGYIITGWTGPSWFYRDVYLIKTDSLGNVGVEEKRVESVKHSNLSGTIFSGPLLLPEGKNCRVFDISGRVIMPDRIKPGIYFIEVNGKITKKVIKIK